MACVDPEGRLSPVARKVLAAIAGGADVPEVAQLAAVPVFRVRASLRELAEAGLLESEGATFRLTEAGRAALAS